MSVDKERLERISTPIEKGDASEHKQMLERRLQEVQVAFSDERYRRERAAGSERLFSDVLQEYSSILVNLREAHYLTLLKLAGPETPERDPSDDAEVATEKYMTEVKAKINEIHGMGGNWQDELTDYLGNEWTRFKWEDQPMKKPEAIGLLHFNTIHQEEGLEHYGITPEDELLEVHLDEAYTSDVPMSALLATMRDAFSKLAVTIADRYPRARAVVGTSWLISHPMAKRFGFQKVEEREVPQNRANTWFQMIDKDGQINARRFKEMLETGELPYKAAFGLIPIEVFLQRYLPPERRGKVVLEVLSPEWVERRRAIEAEGAALRRDWPELTVADIESDALFARIPVTSEILEAIGTKEEFRRAFKVAKMQGRTTLKGFGSEPEYADLFGQLNAKLEDGKYTEREIVIE